MTFIETWQITLLTLKIALFGSCLALPFSLLIGTLFSRYKGFWRVVCESFLLLPVVLPPVAVGLILLSVLSPQHFVGAILKVVLGDILLNWRGGVCVAIVVSFPLQTQLISDSIRKVPKQLLEVAKSFGKSRLQTFWSVILPTISPAIVQGFILGIGRSIGEFGATVLVCGIIPKQTETIALGIYQRIMIGDERDAYQLVAIAILLALFIVGLARFLGQKQERNLRY